MKNFELSEEFFDYIENNSTADVASLYLAAHGREFNFSVDLAHVQIEARRKNARKLSTFIRERKFIFPTLLSAEQATHQCVAKYHASLIDKNQSVADLTAGLGIDAFTIALSNSNKVIAAEMSADRAAALRHNACALGLQVKVEIIEGDSLAWLASEAMRDVRFDVIFIDPARRAADKRRTYLPADCEPNVVKHFDLLASHCNTLMIKASPILDVTAAMREIPQISRIHIVMVKGECKEVLLISDNPRQECTNPRIEVIDLEEPEDASLSIRSIFSCSFSETGGKAPVASEEDLEPGNYLYDPNAGIHKLNCGALLCSRFKSLKKIAPNTDLYVSAEEYPGFPGRIFKITEKPAKKSQKALAGAGREVITRNYPMESSALRAKLKVISGDDGFIIGCRATERNLPLLLDCVRIR